VIYVINSNMLGSRSQQQQKTKGTVKTAWRKLECNHVVLPEQKTRNNKPKESSKACPSVISGREKTSKQGSGLVKPACHQKHKFLHVFARG
jgi:hypothetical protein